MTVTTLPLATTFDVTVANSVDLSEQCRHHAVRTALAYIVDDCPTLALAELIKSVRRCAHLDNRPLSAERVHRRAERLVEQMVAEHYQAHKDDADEWGAPE